MPPKKAKDIMRITRKRKSTASTDAEKSMKKSKRFAAKTHDSLKKKKYRSPIRNSKGKINSHSEQESSPPLTTSENSKGKINSHSEQESSPPLTTSENSKTDKFCWICHQIGQDKVCKACPRVYHTGCLEASKAFGGDDVCHECQLSLIDEAIPPRVVAEIYYYMVAQMAAKIRPNKEKLCYVCGQSQRADLDCSLCSHVFHKRCCEDLYEGEDALCLCSVCYRACPGLKKISDFLHRRQLLKLLEIMLQNERKKIFLNWPSGMKNYLLHHVIDLTHIVSKIHYDKYKSIEEVYAEFQWMHHNCCILFGIDSPEAEDVEVMKDAFHKEVYELDSCAECYYNIHCRDSRESFVKMCTPPHDIIWAQCPGYNYWPAKCIKVVGDTARVRFFADYTMYDIPLSKCFHISENHPKYKNAIITDMRNTGPKNKNYIKAKREFVTYLENFEEEFGKFRFYPERIRYDPKNYETIVGLTSEFTNDETISEDLLKVFKQETLSDESEDEVQVMHETTADRSQPISVKVEKDNSFFDSDAAFSDASSLTPASDLPDEDVPQSSGIQIASISSVTSTNEEASFATVHMPNQHPLNVLALLVSDKTIHKINSSIINEIRNGSENSSNGAAGNNNEVHTNGTANEEVPVPSMNKFLPNFSQNSARSNLADSSNDVPTISRKLDEQSTRPSSSIDNSESENEAFSAIGQSCKQLIDKLVRENITLKKENATLKRKLSEQETLIMTLASYKLQQ